jgi:hypothetical protein
VTDVELLPVQSGTAIEGHPSENLSLSRRCLFAIVLLVSSRGHCDELMVHEVEVSCATLKSL